MSPHDKTGREIRKLMLSPGQLLKERLGYRSCFIIVTL